MGLETGIFCCDTIDVSICMLKYLYESISNYYYCDCNLPKCHDIFLIFPTFLVGCLIDAFGIYLMIFTTCVYYDGSEYTQGISNYTFSLDFTTIADHCKLEYIQNMPVKNQTEVTQHEFYVLMGLVWYVIAILFLSLIPLVYIGLTIKVKFIDDLPICTEDWSDITSNRKLYILMTAFAKVLPILGSLLMTAKAIHVWYYTTLSITEWIIFILALGDGTINVIQGIIIIRDLKTNQEKLLRKSCWCIRFKNKITASKEDDDNRGTKRITVTPRNHVEPQRPQTVMETPIVQQPRRQPLQFAPPMQPMTMQPMTMQHMTMQPMTMQSMTMQPMAMQSMTMQPFYATQMQSQQMFIQDII